ncbi:hypothetical protein LINPERHAP1_LOCUS11711 [Linum perenne]
MAATSFHARSNSLPSDRQHPLVSELDDQVCRLRQSEATTSSSSIYHKLNSLQDLYDCVDQLLQLPLTQQTIVQKSFSELLDGSLRLLDLCSTAKDALSQIKESVFELQSAIRRRQGGLEGETRRYLNSRKIVKKAIHKVLKGMESRTKSNSSATDSEVVTMLREAEAVSVSVLEGLLAFISASKSKSTSWSRDALSQLNESVSELQSAIRRRQGDLVAETKRYLNSRKIVKKAIQKALKGIKNLQPCIQDLEEGVESLFRCLIKTRSSILNIL